MANSFLLEQKKMDLRILKHKLRRTRMKLEELEVLGDQIFN